MHPARSTCITSVFAITVGVSTMQELFDLLREQRVTVAALQATSRALKQSAREPIRKGPAVQHILLLRMAEGLVASHKAAKIDGDGYTLDLIEDAMRHVGERLAAETSDGRYFCRKKLEAL